MGDKASLNIEMPGVDFAGLAREAIAAKLTNALVGADDAIVKIVASAMERKVDGRGNVSGYNYENKTPYVEWLAEDLIRSATLESPQGPRRAPAAGPGGACREAAFEEREVDRCGPHRDVHQEHDRRLWREHQPHRVDEIRAMTQDE